MIKLHVCNYPSASVTLTMCLTTLEIQVALSLTKLAIHTPKSFLHKAGGSSLEVGGRGGDANWEIVSFHSCAQCVYAWSGCRVGVYLKCEGEHFNFAFMVRGFP